MTVRVPKHGDRVKLVGSDWRGTDFYGDIVTVHVDGERYSIERYDRVQTPRYDVYLAIPGEGDGDWYGEIYDDQTLTDEWAVAYVDDDVSKEAPFDFDANIQTMNVRKVRVTQERQSVSLYIEALGHQQIMTWFHEPNSLEDLITALQFAKMERDNYLKENP